MWCATLLAAVLHSVGRCQRRRKHTAANPWARHTSPLANAMASAAERDHAAQLVRRLSDAAAAGDVADILALMRVGVHPCGAKYQCAVGDARFSVLIP